MPKILITGATGFVGANLLRRLVPGGDEIHILNRKTSNAWRIADLLDRTRVHEIDLLEEEKLKKTLEEIRPDYIFHLANAGVYGGVSVSDAELARVNLIGLMNLASALDQIPYRGFVNVGSSSEYGLKREPMAESDVCEPVNTYGVTKLAATAYASYLGRIKGKPILTFRLFSPFGPYDDHRRLISKTILELLAGRSIELANPKAVRDYIFIDDVIDLLLEAKDAAEKHRGEVFNAGSGKEHAIREVVDIISSLIKSNAAIEWGKAAPHAGEPEKWEANMAKTFGAFQWRPKKTLEEDLRLTVEWFREHANLYSQSPRSNP